MHKGKNEQRSNVPRGQNYVLKQGTSKNSVYVLAEIIRPIFTVDNARRLNCY